MEQHIEIPAVMFIESALDTVKTRTHTDVEKMIAEFNMLGDHRKTELLQTIFPNLPVTAGDNNSMIAGYLIGLETMRVMFESNPHLK